MVGRHSQGQGFNICSLLLQLCCADHKFFLWQEYVLPALVAQGILADACLFGLGAACVLVHSYL